jgi:SAM-dependent methyltransferase
MSQPYLSLEAELHDAFWAASDDASEVRLMAEFLRTHPGPALEIGCGSGRLLFPLMEAGFAVEGLELSPDMLRLARTAAEARGLSPVLHLGDMTKWPAPRTYASLLAPAFTLQLADDPAATLRHWHSWLQPSGALYLTIFTPLAELSGDLPEGEWYADHETLLPGGIRAALETRHTLDDRQRLVHREHRYSVAGDPPRIHHSRQTIRWFDDGELTAILDRAGFRVTTAFADFDRTLDAASTAVEATDGILTCHALRRSGA